MTNIQHKETAHEAKPVLFAGIDVGAEELILLSARTQAIRSAEVHNTPQIVFDW